MPKIPLNERTRSQKKWYLHQARRSNAESERSGELVTMPEDVDPAPSVNLVVVVNEDDVRDVAIQEPARQDEPATPKFSDEPSTSSDSRVVILSEKVQVTSAAPDKRQDELVPESEESVAICPDSPHASDKRQDELVPGSEESVDICPDSPMPRTRDKMSLFPSLRNQ